MASQEGATRQGGAVTARAVVLGLALIPLNAYWVILAELRWYMILTLNPLFVTPVFFLLVLVAVNAVLRLARPRWAFSAAELLTVYVMLAISCTVATHDFGINLMSILGFGARFARPENKWEEILFPDMPRWALMWDQRVLRDLYEGGGTLYRADIILAWLRPVLIWVAFIFVMFGVMMCLNVLVRRAWIEETKLSFPIVRLPLAMVGLETPGFFRSKAVWMGMALPIISGTLNGLAVLYPNIPHFNTRARMPHFTSPPWAYLGWTPTSFYPFAIGLGYLVPLDVLFSCWFFYLFIKAQGVLGYYVGLTRIPGYPFQTEQGIGAWITYGVLIVYMTRGHWRRLLRAIWRREPLEDDHELLPYRYALAGVGIGIAALIGFWCAIGMTILPAALVVGLFFLVSLSITRVRADAGSQHTVWDVEPKNVFSLVYSRTLGVGNVIGGGLNHWFWRVGRSHAMPTQLEGFKLWHSVGLSPRSLAWPITVATIVATVAGPWAFLHIGYREGLEAKCIGNASWTGHEAYGWMSQVLTQERPFEWPRLVAVLAASGLMLLLWALQSRYTTIWLHPLGYCAGPQLVWVWFPFLIAWVIKFIIVRYGGHKGYQRALPFFLGVVLGDYLTGAVWAIISPIMDFQGYQIFH